MPSPLPAELREPIQLEPAPAPIGDTPGKPVAAPPPLPPVVPSSDQPPSPAPVAPGATAPGASGAPTADPGPGGAAPTPAGPTLDPALQALIESSMAACRSALARRFKTTAEQVDAWQVPSQAIAIEAGEKTLAALRQEGLQFGWMVRGRPDPAPIGLCRTGGDAAVRAIEEQKD